MKKRKNIRDGWKNFMDKSEVIESLANKRASICESANNGSLCVHAKKKMLSAFIKDSIKSIEGYSCNKCPSIIKCPLSAKIRSKNESCPIGKW